MKVSGRDPLEYQNSEVLMKQDQIWSSLCLQSSLHFVLEGPN